MKEDDLKAAQNAARLIGDPDFMSAVDAISNGYVAAWRNTYPDESEKREHAYFCFKAIEDVRGELKRRANNLKAFEAAKRIEAGNTSRQS